ncbi:MAG: hypothetical protein ACI92S_004770, partial [Planctomycetaceae bacterium]
RTAAFVYFLELAQEIGPFRQIKSVDFTPHGDLLILLGIVCERASRLPCDRLRART